MEIFNLPNSHHNNPNIDDDLRALINKRNGGSDGTASMGNSRGSLRGKTSKRYGSLSNAGVIGTQNIFEPAREVLHEIAGGVEDAIEPIKSEVVGSLERDILQPIRSMGRKYKVAPFQQAYINFKSPKRSRPISANRKALERSVPVTLAITKRARRDQLFKATEDDALDTVKAVCATLTPEDLLMPEWREMKTERTAFHAALENDSPEVADYLIGFGGQPLVSEMYKISIGSRSGLQTALHAFVQAANVQDPNRITLLKKIIRNIGVGSQTGILRRSKDVSMLDKFTIRVDKDRDGHARHFTALHIAAYKGDNDMIGELVEAGAFVDSSHAGNGPTPLFYAVRYGHISTIEKLVKLGANINFSTHNGSTPLYWAVRSERVDIVTLLLDKGASALTSRPVGFGLPLILAVALDNVAIVDIFITRGVDKNSRNTFGRTALHFAAALGHTLLIDPLEGTTNLLNPLGLKRQSPLNYNARDNTGATPLMFAVRGGHADAARVLLKRGACLSAANALKQTVWHFAIQLDDKEQQKKILKVLAEFHVKNYKESENEEQNEEMGIEVEVCPLNEVVIKNNTDLLQTLIDLGIRIDEHDMDGENFLHIAAKKHCFSVVKEHAKSSPPHVINKQNNEGDTPLMVAARYDRPDIAEVLVSSTSLVEFNHLTGITALHLAVKYSPKVATILLKKAQELDVLPHIAELEDEGGNNLLHMAARMDNTEVLSALVNMLDIDAVIDMGDSALHLAVWYTKTEAISFLLKHAQLGTRDHYGRTALHIAASVPGTPAAVIEEIVDAIKRSGNESLIDYKDDMGCTALHLAARKGTPATIAALTDVDPGILNNAGNLALHVAAIRKRPANMQAILKVFEGQFSMRVDHLNQDQASVLHICAKSGDCDSIKDLLRYGADPVKRNIHGDTVLHAVVAETVVEPDNTELMIEVYQTIVGEIVSWWCRARRVEYPDESSTMYRNMKRFAMLELITQVNNSEGMNVISLATALGASRILETILNTDNVFRFSVSKVDYGEPVWEYDVTHLTPGADPKLLWTTKNVGSPAVGSCLDILATMGTNLTAAQILEITPLKQLVENYWSAYQWIYGVLMVIHIVYMGLFTNYAFELLDVTRPVGQTDEQKAAYGMFLIWPVMLFVFEVYYQLATVRAWCVERKQVKVIRKAQETVGGPFGRVSKFTGQVVNAASWIFDNLPHMGAAVFSIFVVVWYILYLTGSANQVYIVAVIIIVGWLYATAFTKGFKSVHAFNTMLKYIIIKDMARFVFIFLFILLAFGFALHSLFLVALFTRTTYNTAWDSLFMTFNMMLGMGSFLDDDSFDSSYRAAGYDPLIPKIVYILYMILATIIFLNLLIAMMSDTYSSVKSNEARTWQISTVTLAVRIERSLGFLRRFLSYIKALNVKYKPIELESPAKYLDDSMPPLYRCMTVVSLNQMSQDQPNQEELVMQRLENKLDSVVRNQNQLRSKVDQLSQTVKMMENKSNKRRHSKTDKKRSTLSMDDLETDC